MASYRSQPPPPGYRSALLSKRSITPSFSASVVVRTAEVNDEFASFADTTADAGVANAYSSSAAADNGSDFFAAAAEEEYALATPASAVVSAKLANSSLTSAVLTRTEAEKDGVILLFDNRADLYPGGGRL